MSHQAEREEKTCLNCGTALNDRYCHHCGQQNVPPQEGVWHFTVHFVHDILHFNGKFFKTLKYLLFRPGFLTREYVAGRRVAYLDPIRMYLFSSFIFFLIFFSFNKTAPTPEEMQALAQQESNISEIASNDSVYVTGINMFSGDFHTREAYDSAAKVSPDPPSWMERKLAYREIEIEKKYGNNEKAFAQQLEESLTHHFPQMLFVSLPLMALILKLLYIRRKKFYFVAHGVFTIHLYVFLFFLLLAGMGIAALESLTGWEWMRFAGYLLIILLSNFYLYRAMRRFYGQRRLKTILKFLLFIIAFWILILLIFIGFVLFTFFEV